MSTYRYIQTWYHLPLMFNKYDVLPMFSLHYRTLCLSAQRLLLSVYISSGCYINSQITESTHPNSLTLAALLDKAILWTGDCHVSILNNDDKLVMLFVITGIDITVHEAELVELHLLILFTWVFWFLTVKARVTILIQTCCFIICYSAWK